jgi:hypothetical protein
MESEGSGNLRKFLLTSDYFCIISFVVLSRDGSVVGFLIRCWLVFKHFKDIPKWHIRKYSIEHFLRNWPIVQIFRGFQKKSADFNELSHKFGIFLAQSG